MHIILTNFEQAAFGKLPSAIGFQKIQHPFTLLYLTWDLHDGYNLSDKGKPLGINSEIIRNFYKALLGYEFNQYQLPLRTRWGYELKTAKQYLEHRNVHIQFARWFIPMLENHNTPDAYLDKWRLFNTWLLNLLVNIQIKILTQFGIYFYEPLFQFFVIQDPIPRILNNNTLEKLPPGCRAHEMPDKVKEWYIYLKDICDNLEIFFADELLEALETLDTNEFDQLFDNLEMGLKKAVESFEKWMFSWCHLPLSICRLGGNSAQLFARSFLHVVLKKPWAISPTDIEVNYSVELEEDYCKPNADDFGLSNLLLNNEEFQKEFEEFSLASNPSLYSYPHLYDFVKTRIYYIVIYQQQIEGLFNKIDLKTHPNMSMDLKQSKLRLSSSTPFMPNKEDLKIELKKIRKEQKKVNNTHLETQSQIFGEETAKSLFNSLFQK
jgi:hypothetical protein